MTMTWPHGNCAALCCTIEVGRREASAAAPSRAQPPGRQGSLDGVEQFVELSGCND
jgi:hypothetical protein